MASDEREEMVQGVQVQALLIMPDGEAWPAAMVLPAMLPGCIAALEDLVDQMRKIRTELPPTGSMAS